MGKSRMEAFSDGVIAIIITIMVLEMKAPEGTSWEIIKPLVPKFLSYGLSFLGVAIYWVNHHHLVHTVSRVTPGILWANINLLFWLSLVPVATAWMGENHFEKTTVTAYAILCLLCAVAYNILQSAIVKGNKKNQIVHDVVKPMGYKEIGSILLYTFSIPVAHFINPVISGFMFLAVSLIWLIPDKKIEKALNE
ncbi:MAG: DUF1211 domain-containing protein [Sphingobacteriales bacterium]|nr:DUF1211 domain-containing protein [Sphingobacteriales bacterium]MBI3717163.1 DUF1211 domain-containing protein [Sphingobacteriales bacterium]